MASSFFSFLIENTRARAGQELSYTKYIAEKISLIESMLRIRFLSVFYHLGRRQSPSLPFVLN